MNDPEPKRGLGCGGIALVLLLVVAIVVVVGVAIGFWVVTSRVLPYTAETPVKVEAASVTEPDYNAVRARIDAARNAQPGSSLRLTAADLNALLALAPEWQGARDRARVEIRDKRVNVTGSFPMPNLPRVQGRFLNGTVWFVPGVANGAFVTDIQQIIANGAPMADAIEKQLDTGFEEALRSFLTNDVVLGPVLIRVKAVEMQPDAVVLKF